MSQMQLQASRLPYNSASQRGKCRKHKQAASVLGVQLKKLYTVIVDGELSDYIRAYKTCVRG